MIYRLLISLLCTTLLSACSALRPDTATELIRAQQQETAYVQRQEQERAELAAKNQPQLLLTLIEENINQQRYFAALAYINSYIQHFGSTPVVAIMHGHVLRNLDQDAEAQAIYEKTLKTNRKAQALHGLGLLAAKQQRYDQAVLYLTEATFLNPTDASALSDLGFAYLSLGQTERARMPLGQASELEPSNQRISANVALLLLMEQKNQAAHALMQAAHLDPSSQSHIQQLALRLQNSNNSLQTKDAVLIETTTTPTVDSILVEAPTQLTNTRHTPLSGVSRHIPLTSN